MLKYICKDRILDNDLSQINNFIEYCATIDNYVYDFQYETETLIIPSIYFCYGNNKILGVLSICEYSIDTLCIYSLIAPEFRNNHIFSTLFDMLQKNLKTPDSPYKHLEFHLPCTNNEFFNPAVFLLNTYNFNFSHEEYLLSYSLEENSSLKTISNEIDVIYDNSIQEFTLWINDNCIGGCMIYSSEDDKTFATIYDYEIVSKYQGKGYGKIWLYLILKELKYMNYKNIILHVSGLNKKAHNLYISCGFNISSLISVYIRKI